MGNLSAGAGFRRREGFSGGLQEFPNGGFQICVFGGVHKRPQQGFKLRQLLLHPPFLLLGVSAVNGQAQADARERIGKVGQVHIGGKGVFPGGNLFRKGRLCDAVYHDIPVQDAVQRLVAADIVHDGRNGAYGLVRDSGKGVERSAAPDVTEHHDGRGPKLVYNDFCGVRDLCLRQVGRQDIQAAVLEDFVDHFQLAGVRYHAFGAGNFPQHSFGDIVLGGAQAAGRNDKGILREFAA